jgi:subtilisin family serine protease
VTSRLSRPHREPPYDAWQMSRNRHLIAVAGILAALIAMPSGATAAPPTTSADQADQTVVRYRNDSTRAERIAVARDLGLSVVTTTPDARTQVVVGPGESAATVRRRLLADRHVEAVGPNLRRELSDDITAEPYFGSEWGLHNTGQTVSGEVGLSDVDIDGLEALRITRGSPDVVVAVIDSGVDFSHPDLADRAWTNPGEIPDNGIDDDGNDYVDDVNGWDFCHGDATVFEGATNWHGTHVAGTIAASLNGVGVVGVAPNVSVMALKFIDGPTCGSDAMAIEAIDYAASFGVPIINASWGGQGFSDPLDKAMGESGALFVAAAGNQSLDLDDPANDFYPARSTQPNVLSVAAIDQRGELAVFSNFGATTVDIAAPGVNVLSSVAAQRGCDPCWGYADGTSMAAPHVSGVAALATTVMTGPFSATGLRAQVLGRAVALPTTAGLTATGRSVNAWRVVDLVGPVARPPSRYWFANASAIGSAINTNVAWPAAADDHSGVVSYVVRRRFGTASWAVVANAAPTPTYRGNLPFGISTRFSDAGRDGAGNVGATAIGGLVTAILFQDTSSLATYSGAWSTVSTSTASGGRLHASSRAGASVTFRTSGRAMAVVGRLGPANGQAKVYVDGVYVRTVDFHRTTTRSRVVVFQRSWATSGTHTIKVVVVGTAGHPKVEVDAFPVLR